MKLMVQGKQLNLSGALRKHVERRLTSGISKYFDNAIEAQVIFSRDAHHFVTSISVHAGPGITFQSRAELDDIHASFDAAAERIEKQLRRQKKRLISHHRGHGGRGPATVE
ncbi:MAG: ribosome-associated translation inhibitor RaiA [Proteobacteria bacterium]|nr:ribosome-associated translation inhibitor RaiA [Pseudomonadota bacterium]